MYTLSSTILSVKTDNIKSGDNSTKVDSNRINIIKNNLKINHKQLDKTTYKYNKSLEIKKDMGYFETKTKSN